jgi:UDP-GlcNAc:undecaprenyl-phosphate GlcNAc-1-phosphate transferase
MFLHNYLYYHLFIVTFATVITSIGIPSILHVTHSYHLFDDPNLFRKTHGNSIPRLGGIAIFLGFIITFSMFCMTAKSLPYNYLIASCIILFAMGLKDDLSGVNPSTKFLIQLTVCLILVVLGNIRLASMFGLFGIYELSYFVSIGLSIFILLLIVNAFNLIDGIDGLAAITGILTNGAFAAMFIYIHQYELASVSLTMAGSILGFLRYNITPAKIFMGDTGALLIGLISALMALKLIEAAMNGYGESHQVEYVPILTFAILIGPIYDTARVFIVRIANGNSPFKADRGHIHHRILTLGFNHIQTTMILTMINITAVVIVLLFKDYGNSILALLIITPFSIANWIITFFIKSREHKSWRTRNLSTKIR